MRELKKELKSFGDSLESAMESMKNEGVSAPTWGTVLSLPQLLGVFLTDGRYDIGGKGDIVVPPDLDFIHEPAKDADFWKITVTKGFPYFEGKGFVKLFDTLLGVPMVKSITIHRDCRKGQINIENFMDFPFELLR